MSDTYGPGSRPSDRAADGVSPVPASIPIADRVLLIEVPADWLWNAARMAALYREQHASKRNSGSANCVVFACGTETFAVWHSASGKQISVRHLP